MNRFAVAAVVCATVVSASSASGQVLDLAGPATQPLAVAPGVPPNIRIINKVPRFKYTVLITVEDREVPPIDLPEGFKPGELFFSGFTVCDEKPFNEWLASVEEAPDESAIAAAVGDDAVAELRKKMQAQGPGRQNPAGGGTCWDLVATRVRDTINATRQTVNLAGYVLGENQTLTVTVTRAEEASDVKTWKAILSTPAAGRWLTTWGFGFVNDRDEQWVQQAQPDGTFSIVKRGARKWTDMDMKFVPSVFFHWMPRRANQRNWAFSPLTVGLGMSKDAPAVLIGMSTTLRQNVSIVGGIAGTRVRRLNDDYTENQSLKERIADDGLYENTYRPAVFLSVAIRFSRNPFAENGGGGQ